MSAREALIAAQRFGPGARPGDLTRLAGDPPGWLLGQIRKDAPLPPGLAGIQPSAQRVVELNEVRKDNREMKAAGKKGSDAFAQLKARQRDIYLGDATARLCAR